MAQAALLDALLLGLVRHLSLEQFVVSATRHALLNGVLGQAAEAGSEAEAARCSGNGSRHRSDTKASRTTTEGASDTTSDTTKDAESRFRDGAPHGRVPLRFGVCLDGRLQARVRRGGVLLPATDVEPLRGDLEFAVVVAHGASACGNFTTPVWQTCHRCATLSPVPSISLDLLPAQRALWDSTAPKVAFVGGYGAGKTRAAVYKMVQLSIANRRAGVSLFLEPTYPMVRDVAMRSAVEVLEEMGLPYALRRAEATLDIGPPDDVWHRWLLRSGDVPERLVGVNACAAVIDEPALQDEEVALRVVGRLREPRARQRQLVLTGTPEGMGWLHRWCVVSPPPDLELVRARTSDNPFLPPEYEAGIRERYSPEQARAYLEGEFVRLDGAWSRVKPAVLPHVPMPGAKDVKVYRDVKATSGQIVIGVDTAGGLGRDSSAIAVVDKRDRALCASWVSSSATISQIVDVLAVVAKAYSVTEPHPYLVGGPAIERSKPAVVVETNGIGQATWQAAAARAIPHLQGVTTTEASKYRGLLHVRRAIEDRQLAGPQELADEADDLHVRDGRFEGKKDLSMACGFAFVAIDAAPYRAPEQPKPRDVFDFDAKLGRKATWGITR